MDGINELLLWNLALTAGIASVIALASQTRPLRNRPGIRHALWMFVLFKLITPPLIPVPLLAAGDASASTARPISKPSDLTINPDSSVTSATDSDIALHAMTAADSRLLPTRIRSPEHSTKSAVRSGGRFSLCCGIVWAIGTILCFTRGGWQWLAVSRWIRRSEPADSDLTALAERKAARMGVRRVPRVRVVSARITPLLWVRHGTPVIVLPKSLVDQFDPQQLSCVICHELAHFLRRDPASNLFAFAVTSVFWWNPVAWWARREVRVSQEACCDSLVVRNDYSNRRCYAETLLRVIDFLSQESTSPLPFANGFGNDRSLERRFEMLSNSSVSERVAPTVRIGIGCMLLFVSCYPVFAQSSERSDEASPKTPTDLSSDSLPKSPDATRLRSDPVAPPPTQDDLPSTRFTTIVYELKNSDAETIQELLLAMKLDAEIDADPQKNTLLVTATQSVHRSMVELLKRIDRRDPSGLRAIQLKHFDSEDAAKILAQTLGDDDSIRVRVDKQQNRLIVYTDEQRYKHISELVRSLEAIAGARQPEHDQESSDPDSAEAAPDDPASGEVTIRVHDRVIVHMRGELSRKFQSQIGHPPPNDAPADFEITAIATVHQLLDENRARLELSLPIRPKDSVHRMMTVQIRVDRKRITSEVIAAGTPIQSSPSATPSSTTKEETRMLHLHDLTDPDEVEMRIWELIEPTESP